MASSSSSNAPSPYLPQILALMGKGQGKGASPAGTPDQLRPVMPSSAFGSEASQLARLQAARQTEKKSFLKQLHDAAVQKKTQGNEAMKQGQYATAVREYNQALETAWKVCEYLAQDMPDQPLNGYQVRALERGQKIPLTGAESVEPFRALVHSNRSLAFLKLDAFDKALEDANEALRLEPRYLKAWIRRAAALAASNKVDRALEVLDEALDKACPVDAAKEQVCKLIVQLRCLDKVSVKKPSQEIPERYIMPKEDELKKAKKEVPVQKVKVPMKPLDEPEEKEATEKKAPIPTRKDENESSIEYLTSLFRRQGGSQAPVTQEVEARDLNIFIAEEWHPTHLGGRWRQTMDELSIVVTLPRRPKANDIKVQIRPNHIWTLVRKEGANNEDIPENFQTIVDHKLAGTVLPAKSCWYLEASGAKEIHFTLVKQADVDQKEDVLRRLWERAFEGDARVDTERIAMAKAAKAALASMPLHEALERIHGESVLARVEGDYDKAERLEAFVEAVMERLQKAKETEDQAAAKKAVMLKVNADGVSFVRSSEKSG